LAWLRVVVGVLRLVGRLGGAALGFLWARRRASRAFYRRLVRAGVPEEAARDLADGYHGPSLLELFNRRG